MRIIAKRTLRQFWERGSGFADAEMPLRAWHAETRAARWRSPAEVRSPFRTASILKSGRVVFNIAGNKYRLVAEIRYDLGIVFVRFVGTHAEYDRIDAGTV